MNLALLADQNVERFGTYVAVIFDDRPVTNLEQVAGGHGFAGPPADRWRARRPGGGHAPQLRRGVSAGRQGHPWEPAVDGRTLAEDADVTPDDVGLMALPVSHPFGMISGITGQVLGTRGVLLRWFSV